MALKPDLQVLLERICASGPVMGVELAKADLARVSSLNADGYIAHDGKGWIATERGRKKVTEG